MAFNGDNNYAGGLSYSTPAFILGAYNGTAINGGLSFDLPLATVAAFNSQALNFAANANANALGFATGVINKASGQVSASQTRTNDLLGTALQSAQSMFNKQQNEQSTRAYYASRGKGCFITTAICKSEGKPDDCYELQTLRRFRDDFMLKTTEGAELVKKYYAIAPSIVRQLEIEADGGAEYFYALRVGYLLPAIAAIEAGKYDDALSLYTRMVSVAQKLAV